MTAQSDIYYSLLKVLKGLQVLIFCKNEMGEGRVEKEEKFLKIEFLREKEH